MATLYTKTQVRWWLIPAIKAYGVFLVLFNRPINDGVIAKLCSRGIRLKQGERRG